MRYGDEQVQVQEWLYTTLSTDAELATLAGVPVGDLPSRVWPETAPADTPEPFAVYSAGEALDQGVLGDGARVFTTVPVNVRWVTRADADATAGPAQRRLYAILHGATNVPLAGGGVILTSTRLAALNYREESEGTEYRHVGGLFTVEVN